MSSPDVNELRVVFDLSWTLRNRAISEIRNEAWLRKITIEFEEDRRLFGSTVRLVIHGTDAELDAFKEWLLSLRASMLARRDRAVQP